MLFALGGLRGLIGGGSPMQRLQRSLPLGLGRLFIVPAAKRALKEGPELLAAAMAGDIQAAMDLLRKTAWAATSAAKANFQRYYDQLPAKYRVEPMQAGPPGTPVIFSQLSARVKARKATAERTTRAPQAKASRVRQPRVAGQVHEAEAYQGRRSVRRERGTGERWAKRYDPLTGAAWRVPESDARFDSWDSRRPRAGARAYGRSTGSRGLAGAAARGASRLPAAAAALGAGTAAAVAVVGAAAYYITSRVLDDIAEGNTGANLVGLITALAHSQLTRKLKRQPTRAEYRDLVVDARQQLQAAVREAMAPSLKTQLRNFLNLWR